MHPFETINSNPIVVPVLPSREAYPNQNEAYRVKNDYERMEEEREMRN